uniref:MINDY deubiquitinase domain-containing protein n=1 Tax=Rhodosorus marinus TaxID=101924 RepID=A0A7S3EA32_9RHOD|mmetsp:Transcript_17265/g.70107  ORF Transcript_17265/g.70107 Transcript_17265/m.70107 type:complete len:159 (+) Transcript_17265:78-554(+)
MPSEEFEDNYRIKWITERSTGKKYAVLLQNRNGPCPLLAISNALLLRGNIDIHEDMSHVNEEMLIEKITEYIFRANPLLREGEEEVVANEQQNLADVITTLPKLKKGLVSFNQSLWWLADRALANFLFSQKKMLLRNRCECEVQCPRCIRVYARVELL